MTKGGQAATRGSEKRATKRHIRHEKFRRCRTALARDRTEVESPTAILRERSPTCFTSLGVARRQIGGGSFELRITLIDANEEGNVRVNWVFSDRKPDAP